LPGDAHGRTFLHRRGAARRPTGTARGTNLVRLDVQPLTRDRWPDLAELFDRPGGSIVRGCWCMYYRNTGASGGQGNRNRAAMKRLVDRGVVPGLIGYLDGSPVAWLSLGPREEYAKLRRSPVMKPVDDRPVWSIVCFYVDRRVRGQHVAERMLRAGMAYARSQGVRTLEAYPVDKPEPSHDEFMFYGAKTMFDRAGFVEVARRTKTRPVMRRALRPRVKAV
jgi:ribosomal protein S18 acetylase RimI-like enzyme